MPNLTLDAVARQPELVMTRLTLPSGQPVLFRPLLPTDEGLLTTFIESLSAATIGFHSFDPDGPSAAREMCFAVNRYDKLRMAAVINGDREPQIIALFGFSLALVQTDHARYRQYGLELDPEATCRFGPCIADAYQNQGVGTRLFPLMVEIARRFGRRRIILWGGVQAANARAIAYYRKNGFRRMGRFEGSNGLACCDMMLNITGVSASRRRNRGFG